jgi:hypothetical protein
VWTSLPIAGEKKGSARGSVQGGCALGNRTQNSRVAGANFIGFSFGPVVNYSQRKHSIHICIVRISSRLSMSTVPAL